MKFIKVVTKNGNKAIINMAHIAYIYGLSDKKTNITLIGEEKYFTVEIGIDELEMALYASDNDINVFDFTPTKKQTTPERRSDESKSKSLQNS
jgi:uncharacterized protein YlzI (FlbEa/FlbD family)